MRGVGRFDKRGSISDALKQGLLTYGGGQVARHLGGAGMQTGYNPMGGMGAQGTSAWSSPFGTDTGFKMGAWGGAKTPAAEGVTTAVAPPSKLPTTSGSDQGFFSKVLFGKEGGGVPVFGDKGLIGAGGRFGMKEAFGKGVPAVFAGSTLAAMATQKALNQVGEREPGESLTEFNKRREDTVGQYLAYYYKRANKFRIPPEEMDAAAAKFVADNTKEYVSQGGRIGLAFGTPEEGIKSLDAGAPDITYEGNEGPQAPQQMAGIGGVMKLFENYDGSFDRDTFDAMYNDFLEDNRGMKLHNFAENWLGMVKKGPVLPSPEDPINPWAPKPTGPVLPNKQMAAQGGRIGAYGGGVMGIGTPGMGLPGIPRMAPDGIEYDMSVNGGFQPLGAKEGKDDVKANLAKNEFVFTADAVRGAGDGDIELGAQRMYDTMKNLERRMA
jgi:hypothetical protein